LYKSTQPGLLDKWVKYNKYYFYLFIPFFIITIIITDLYSAFRSKDTEALDAAQED